MTQHSETRTVKVVNPSGLHARPSLAVTQTVRRFHSKVEIRLDRQVADGGEILQLMSLGVPYGSELLLTATGPDAAEVLDALARQFAEGFGLLGDT